VVLAVVVAVLIGAMVLVLGVFVSRGILRRGRVRRPVAVTIRAALIAVSIDTVIFAIAASNAFTFSDADPAGPFIRSGILLFVSALVVGPLVWLWMAFAHRGPAVTVPVTPVATTAPVAPVTADAPPPPPAEPGYTTAPPQP
jgi:hypothetical protein